MHKHYEEELTFIILWEETRRRKKSNQFINVGRI